MSNEEKLIARQGQLNQGEFLVNGKMQIEK